MAPAAPGRRVIGYNVEGVSDEAVDPTREAFVPLYGTLCWHVRQGHGSFLTIEFGEPRLVVYPPREQLVAVTAGRRRRVPRRVVAVRGAWHLWLTYCAWTLRLHGERLATWTSRRRQIERAAAVLEGQALTGVVVDPHTVRTVFTFDLGGVLETRPAAAAAGDDGPAEQWALYEPSGNVLVLRADGCASRQPGNAPPEQAQWRPLPGRRH
jgi:hypothetical protein